jgi:hypothetical protein
VVEPTGASIVGCRVSRRRLPFLDREFVDRVTGLLGRGKS